MGRNKDHLQWFDDFRGTPPYERLSRRPIAYFCSEYALSPDLPIYAGGLGVLAGDMVREAGDQRIPLIALGLYYHEGYVCDREDDSGRRADVCVRTRPEDAGLDILKDEKGAPVIVTVPIAERNVKAQVWKWHEDENIAYFFDTNIGENESDDRHITDRLYVGDKETRLKQLLLLGVGGMRLLEALEVHPAIYHMNEGHSAFLALELIRHEMQERGLSFDEAKQFAKRRIIMTNHTLVAAGNEVYSNDLVAMMLSGYARELQIPVDELVKMGLVQESSRFSMTMLALRMAGIVNAVSNLHAKKAREIWADHPMVGVTNGVHVPTWDTIATDVSKRGAFWKRHLGAKQGLLDHIEKTTGKIWDKNHFIVGWARRLVTYKRPTALVDDLRGIAEIARNDARPVRIVYSGIPHPSDNEGVAMLTHIRDLAEGELKDVLVYLPGYGINLAKLLLAGCDVWLNTPVVGFEACGTSGMKAALNGVLPLSTDDGWVNEAELYRVGWLLDSVHITESILGVLKNDILPMYYDRNAEGIPELWEEHMRNARDMALEEFSATRMLQEYIQKLYL